MKTPFGWTCPFCNHATTINEDNYFLTENTVNHGSKYGFIYIVNEYIVCPNPDCGEFTLRTFLHRGLINPNGTHKKECDPMYSRTLIPKSNAKCFPEFIPKPILDDYNEACLIQELSPKASATLSRRCLQGMIRDFWKVSGNNLFDEINRIRDKVDPTTWDAIDSVRTIGNIGAHMEKDINTIIDVDLEEARLLITLIEDLITDWYIVSHERALRYQKIIETKEKIKSEKK